MAKIHVLSADDENNFTIVIHTSVSAGNNAIGVSWKNAGLASGKTGSTMLTEGLNGWQISTAERASIIEGDRLEIVTSIKVGSGGVTQAGLNIFADIKIAEYNVILARQLKYFGYSVT